MNRLLMRFGLLLFSLSGLMSSLPAHSAPAQKYVVKPVAQKKVDRLPAGPLYWRIETFPTLADAKAAVGPDGWDPAAVRYDTKESLVAQVGGKVWVATLGPPGGSLPGGTKVAEIGPIPAIHASGYLLRLNYGSGPPGASTPVHSHPGSESFYVIRGRLGQRTAQGVGYVDAGQTMNGHSAGTTMQVFNAGDTDLEALILFVVDAGKPFSVPSKFAGR